MILLDTHILIWSSTDDFRLGKQARFMISQCDIANPFYVSSVSAWEIAMLVKKGRIDLGSPAKNWFNQASESPSWRTLPLDAETAMASVNLPGDLHADPADRFLIAAARVHNLALLTADRAILAYASMGHVKAIDAGSNP